LLIDGTFDERQWNASSFTGFLAQFPELVAVDATTKPPTVVLREAEKESIPDSGESPGRQTYGSPSREWRIRSDLWSAVLDYESGNVFLWDDGAVRAVPPDQVDSADPRPRLPTVNGDLLREWRQAFVQQHEDEGEAALDALKKWA